MGWRYGFTQNRAIELKSGLPFKILRNDRAGFIGCRSGANARGSQFVARVGVLGGWGRRAVGLRFVLRAVWVVAAAGDDATAKIRARPNVGDQEKG